MSEPVLTPEQFRRQFDIITITKDYFDITADDIPDSVAFTLYRPRSAVSLPPYSFKFDLSNCNPKPQGLYQNFAYAEDGSYRLAVIDPDGYIIPTRCGALAGFNDKWNWTTKHVETKDMIVLSTSFMFNTLYTRYSDDVLRRMPILPVQVINPIYRSETPSGAPFHCTFY